MLDTRLEEKNRSSHGFPDMNCSELIDYFSQTGYNARRLAEATETIREMIDSDATICLTLAGAMTPIGLGKAIATMIEHGFIDWIVSTGANVYHDLHFAYDLPVRHGYYNVDDDILYKNQIVRIYDTYKGSWNVTGSRHYNSKEHEDKDKVNDY